MNDEKKKKVREEFEQVSGITSTIETLEEYNKRITDWWLSQIDQAVKESKEEERQFILNVLDDIDIEDTEHGFVDSRTGIIRLRLTSRI